MFRRWMNSATAVRGLALRRPVSDGARPFEDTPRVRWLAALIVVVLLSEALILAVNFGPSPASAANAIQIENGNPGDPTWDDFASVAQQDAISGYGSKISVNHGDSIDFFVTTTAASFTIDIFRTGWYGGVGARKMASLGSFPGVHQAIPAPDPVTGMVACNWTKTTTLAIPSTWTTGAYLAKLTASNGNKSYIFFVVRNDGGSEDIAIQTSVTTYQAYNAWGGVSLYTNNTNRSIYPYDLATKVSFDRPFDPLDSNGAGHFLYYEYPFIRWAESQGVNLTYITDVDTHTNVNPLTNHKAYLSIGHDEYWSKGMRDNVQNAISAGVNAAFFSANTMYWQIRFEPNAAGSPNRVMVDYKDSATSTAPPGPDPQWNVNNTIVTTRWRDAPVSLPENGLIGVMYQDQVNQNYAYVVQNSSNWVYAGTGFADGSKVPGIVGYEYDKVWNNGLTPAGLIVLGNSPVVGCCEGSGSSVSNSSLYTAPSGARVFAAGTIQWSWGLDNYSASFANAGIQRTTANILNNFIGGGGATPTLTPTPTATSTGPAGTATATPTDTPGPATTPTPSATPSNTPMPPTATAGSTATPTTTAAPATATATATATSTPAAGGTVLFGDGFEGASLPGAWTTTKLSTGDTLALDSTLSRSGTQSLKAVQARKSNGNAYVSKTLSAGQSRADARGYYYLSSPVNYGAVPLLALYSGSTFLAEVVYNVDPSAPSLQVYLGANNTWYTCGAPPSLNAWHSLELQLALSTGSSGSFGLWLDGAAACQASNIKTSPQSGAAINRVQAGVMGADASGGLTVHVDDVVVSTGYVGP